MTPADPGLRITTITAAQTYPLRQSVLRAGLPPEACSFPGDEQPTTTHLGAFRGDALIGIATLMQQPMPAVPDPPSPDLQATASDDLGPAASPPPGPAPADRDAPAVRLRGMAVAPDARGQGIGAALMRASLQHARHTGATRFWCHARTPAVRFYERHGLTTTGPPFDIPTAGPHRLMWRPLAPDPASPG